jgi:hypothetical protein
MRNFVLASAGSVILLFSSASYAIADQSSTPPPTPATPPAPAATPKPTTVSGDFRDVAVAACVTEAKSQGAKAGATSVMLNKVEDTDKKSDARGAVRASVKITTPDKDGKPKTVKKTFKCDTQNGQVTSFKYT